MRTTVNTLLALAVITSGARAQNGYATLTGVVVDSATRRGLSGVVLVVDGASSPTLSGATGEFHLSGLGVGPHVITFNKTGFAPRSFRFTLTDNHMGSMPLGSISLQASSEPGTQIGGLVLEGSTRQPIPIVEVVVDGVRRGSTDSSGQFNVTDVGYGPHRLEFRRIGYSPYAVDVWVGPEQPEVVLGVDLVALPVQLAEIVVEGERTIFAFGEMRGFHRRREAGIGHFLTHWEIADRNPQVLGDVLRTIPGVQLLPTPGDLNRANRIRMVRGGEFCVPQVFMDGVRIADATADDLPPPEYVGGMEVYQGPSEVPARFNQVGTACGAIIIWTR